MPRVYGVQDADDKLSGWMSEDETETAPTGETAVLESVIRAADPPGADGRIQSGGHWDGTSYTPPAGTEYFIPSTNAVAMAANTMLDVFDEGLAYIEDNRYFWTQEVVSAAITGIHWQIINSARIALNAVQTAAYRQKWCEESGSWPSGVNGNAREYVDAFAELQTFFVPSKDFSWVEDTATPTRLDLIGATTAFSSATNVEDAPTSAKLAGRAWINDIPA